MTQATHFNVRALTTFVEQLFEKAGADAEVAQVVTQVLLEGELLGHRTHGLNLVSRYIGGMLEGTVKARAQALEQVSHSDVSSVFDGHYLLGPYCVSRALDCAAKGGDCAGHRYCGGAPCFAHRLPGRLSQALYRPGPGGEQGMTLSPELLADLDRLAGQLQLPALSQ